MFIVGLYISSYPDHVLIHCRTLHLLLDFTSSIRLYFYHRSLYLYIVGLCVYHRTLFYFI